MTRTTVLDIETTVRDGYEVSFEDLDCWQLVAVALSHRSHPAADPDTRVFVREDGSDRAERKLLAQTTNWLRDHKTDTILTFNGLGFDFPILEARAEALIKSDRPRRQSLAVALFDALDETHCDLFDELKTMQPDDEKWPTLGEALEARGIEKGTPQFGGELVSGGMVPAWGRKILARNEALTGREDIALRQYAMSDVEPVHALYDALAEERQERIESEARAVTQTGQTEHNTEAGR